MKTSELLPDYIPLPPPEPDASGVEKGPQDMLNKFAQAYGELSNRTAMVEGNVDLMI